MSPTEPEYRSPLWIVGVLCALRDQGRHSNEEIAEKLGFGSIEVMQNQLKSWGLPDWLIGEEAAGTPRTTRKKSGRGRQARGSGPVRELPPASNAVPLFREKLESLLQAVEDLKHRKEKLQGGRFVQSAVYRDPVFLSRGAIADEEWQTIRELLDLDSEAKEHMYFGGATFNLEGGTSTPQAPLPALIGAYLLAGGEVESLAEALHPDPASAEWPKINKRIEGRKGKDNLDGLKALTKQLATALRGGTLRSGSPVAELSAHEINLASRITERREAQVSDEKIYEDLLHGLRLSEKELSWGEFQRLADLEQRFPWP